jgi:hypothetical protein
MSSETKHEHTEWLALPQLREGAKALAEQIRAVRDDAPVQGGSIPRGWPDELRTRFLDVRAALFQRGVFDPVLVRFDSATAPPADKGRIADALAALADSLV